MSKGRRNGFCIGSPIPLPDALVVAEGKCLVLKNGPTQGPSKLAIERRRSQASRQRGIGGELVIRVSCQLGAASPVVECVPMKFVGSRLGLCVDHRGDRLAEFRVVAL